MADTSTDPALIERELAAVIRRSRAARRRAEEADAERDQLVRAALKAGLSRARVVGITERSPARIEQIRRGARR